MPFNSEWNQIVFGRGDPKKVLAAYDIYSLRIGALQRANERIDALIAIDFAKLLAPLLEWVMRVKKFQLAQKFQRQLNRLIADLEAAESGGDHDRGENGAQYAGLGDHSLPTDNEFTFQP